MKGLLVRYGPSASHLAFISDAAAGHRRHIILVGGLTDGLLFAPYAPALRAAAHAVRVVWLASPGHQ